MSEPVYLLDTNVVLNLVRANALGRYMASVFDLRNPRFRPLISIVTHGELRVMADRNAWGEKKYASLDKALSQLVTVDISAPEVLDAYLEVDRISRSQPSGSRTMSHNDSWIAACAIACQAVLLTTDKDFLHLHPEPCPVHWIDPKRGRQD